MNKDAKHKASMEKQKTNVDASIAAADTDKSLVVLLTGNGKGKTSYAFGMVMRAMGYGQRVGIVQFIKGEQLSGEELFARENLPQSDFYQMGTGFTWDTQDRQADIDAKTVQNLSLQFHALMCQSSPLSLEVHTELETTVCVAVHTIHVSFSCGQTAESRSWVVHKRQMF